MRCFVLSVTTIAKKFLSGLYRGLRVHGDTFVGLQTAVAIATHSYPRSFKAWFSDPPLETQLTSKHGQMALEF